MLSGRNDKLLKVPSTVHRWISNLSINAATKYRLQKLILVSLDQGNRDFFLTKNEFEILIESKSRRTQKEFIGILESQGIIEILEENHFNIHFEISQNMFSANHVMEKSPKLTLKYEKSNAYNHGVDGATQMPPHKETTEKYYEMISELLSEVTQKCVLEKIGQNASLRKAYVDRSRSIRAKIKSFEKRNVTTLPSAHINLDSVEKLLGTIKIFDPVSQTFEEQRACNRIKMGAKELVIYFYRKLSAKLGENVMAKVWPSEISAAKDILHQLADREADFIRQYIDWLIEEQVGIQQLYRARYHVPQYLQILADRQEWGPIFATWLGQYPTMPTPDKVRNDQHLVCYYGQLFEKIYGHPYRPVNSFAKDLARLVQLKTYHGDDLEKTARFLHWAFLTVLPSQKHKPAQPGDLYRYMGDFRDVQLAPEPVVLSQEERVLIKLQAIIKRAAKRSSTLKLDKTEKIAISQILVQFKIQQFDDETRRIIETNSEIFQVSDDTVQLRIT